MPKSTTEPTQRQPSFGADISARLDELAALSSDADKLTRLYLSPAHRAAVDLVLGWMTAAGMTARLDAAGTVVGRYEATTPNAPALLLGSHIDTVRDGGRFDGALGVVSAIAVVAHLNAATTRLAFAIEVVAFGDEEGVRFSSTLGGSRALVGRFDPVLLDEIDADGISRRQALIDFGCEPARIASEARDPQQIIGYIELHIEQGPVLEAEDCATAVVTAINGATRGTVTLRGVSGHAGTVPMPMRRDALAAAAEMILAVEHRAAVEPDLVATVGRIEIANAATNTVPGSVTFTLDIRSPSDAQRHAAARDIERRIAAIADTRGIQADVALTYDAPSATADLQLSNHLAAASAHLGLTVRRMPSGAGHDAMAFEGRIPFAMLFVRCRGGVSHNPAEFAGTADIDAAARVLEQFVLTLQPPASA